MLSYTSILVVCVATFVLDGVWIDSYLFVGFVLFYCFDWFDVLEFVVEFAVCILCCMFTFCCWCLLAVEIC